MSTISSILKDEPSSITDLQPSLPRHAGRIIRRCLAKDPNRRYQTALDLRNELEELKTEIDSGVHAAEATGATGPSRRRIKPSIVGGLGLIVMVAAAVIVAIQLRNRSDQALPVKLVPRPVTATTAWDSDSSWSPDGKFIAFTRMKSGNLDIYVQSVDGGQAVARVEGPGDQKHPRWSPDNRYLAYISTETPGSPVFLVPPDGGRSKELISTNVPTLSMAESLGSRPWSNDGASLLVSRVLENGQLAVFRVDVLTGEATQVTFPPAGSVDLRATHSFDGERILFLRGNNLAGRMMVMPAGGEEPEVLSERWATTAVWRSDNQHVLFTLQGGTQQELVEINVDTGESRTVFDAPSLGKVAVSADDRIVYSDFRHDTFLFIVDTETGERRQVTSHTRNNFAPRFSPDGRTIAYTSNRTGAFEVWLHRLDDGNETRLIDGLGANVLPAWSPDGRRIVFSSNREDGEPKWYIANADGGGGARRLIDQAINWQGPTSTVVSTSRWSPGGELISYIVIGDEGGELWTVAPDGEGAQRRLTDITGFDWYTSSRTGLVSRLRGSEKELRAVDLETGREEILFVGAFREIDVAPDGSAVAFCFGRGHVSMGLAVLGLEPPSEPGGLPTAIGEPEYVVRTEGTWHVHFGGWSPDSRKLVYVRDWDYGDIYELVERR